MDRLTRCKKHPTYEGKRKPRTPCAPCWQILLSTLTTPQDFELAFALMREQGLGRETA